MSDLAFNINGESFEVPAAASGWRVRRMKQRGAPEVVYGRDGVPLVIPIESDLEELRRNVDAPGRFRLDAVDERGRSIEDVPAAYVQVASLVDAPAPLAQAAQTAAPQGPEGVVAEAMRLNTELARSIIERFPDMMSAAAEILRAADGAGLPRREPRMIADDYDDEADDIRAASSPTTELISNLITQVVPMLMMSLGNGGSKPKLELASVLDWRKAAKQAKAIPSNDAPAETGEQTENPASAMPQITPEMMTDFIAIQSALKPEEAALAREVASTLTPAELHGWIEELGKLSVPQAVQKIRVLIAGNTEATP